MAAGKGDIFDRKAIAAVLPRIDMVAALEPAFAVAARLDQISLAREPIAKREHQAGFVFDEEQPLHARDP